MSTTPYNKDLYLGQSISSLTVNKNDRFNLGLNIYDDQGVAWGDGHIVNLYQRMSESDNYSGSGTYLNHYSGSTLSGSTTIFIDSSGSAYPGNYKFEVIVTSGSGASDPLVSFGLFNFVVTADPQGLSRAFDVEIRKTTVDFLREYIGDEDHLMFPTDGDLDEILRSRVDWGTQSEIINCNKKHFYSGIPGPVLDIEIISAVAGNTYRIDENSKHVAWVSGVAPSDNDQITISFVNVYFFGAVRDCLIQIATNRAKLSVKAKAEGMSHDLTELRSQIMKQAMAIAAVESWEPR